jgi:hypothetical protein
MFHARTLPDTTQIFKDPLLGKHPISRHKRNATCLHHHNTLLLHNDPHPLIPSSSSTASPHPLAANHLLPSRRSRLVLFAAAPGTQTVRHEQIALLMQRNPWSRDLEVRCVHAEHWGGRGAEERVETLKGAVGDVCAAREGEEGGVGKEVLVVVDGSAASVLQRYEILYVRGRRG